MHQRPWGPGKMSVTPCSCSRRASGHALCGSHVGVSDLSVDSMALWLHSQAQQLQKASRWDMLHVLPHLDMVGAECKSRARQHINRAECSS